ncbi:hypothetical protein L1D34_19770 [Vibrio mediterranei]|uniref:hypothetical protein n=1 Tax=Vibrio mediterranei TaxID=689 RepID=UPI0013748186|nr:hypothetical protein [Vibrio mediterranei]MCG9627077.1 hypothetical protein [Vibrio mediterranei]
MTYREFQHTDTYKLMIGTGELISSIASFLFTLITAITKAGIWLTKKTYLWIAKR